MIDTTKKYWTGENFSDLKEYLNLLWKQEMHVFLGKTLQANCLCGYDIFQFKYFPDDGIALTTCSRCRKSFFICDSGEYYEEVVKSENPRELKCNICKTKDFQMGIGFSYRENDINKDIKWIIVGTRCQRCGTLGSPIDWEINYGPTNHLENILIPVELKQDGH
jgi:hypothetical protein